MKPKTTVPHICYGGRLLWIWLTVMNSGMHSVAINFPSTALWIHISVQPEGMGKQDLFTWITALIGYTGLTSLHHPCRTVSSCVTPWDILHALTTHLTYCACFPRIPHKKVIKSDCHFRHYSMYVRTACTPQCPQTLWPTACIMWQAQRF